MDKGTSNVPGDSKPCSTCGIVKPLDEFSFDKRRRDGRQARCRKCVSAYRKRYRQDNRDRYLELRRAEVRRRRDKDRAYKQANKERARQQRLAREASLSEEQVQRRREQGRAGSAAYRLRNPDLCSRRIRNWKKANPDKPSEYLNRRRARKRGNGARERFERSEIGDRDAWICGICEQPIDKTLRFPDQQSPSLDHVVPLALGGEHSRANSRITHWICNVRRNIGRSAA